MDSAELCVCLCCYVALLVVAIRLCDTSGLAEEEEQEERSGRRRSHLLQEHRSEASATNNRDLGFFSPFIIEQSSRLGELWPQLFSYHIQYN